MPDFKQIFGIRVQNLKPREKLLPKLYTVLHTRSDHCSNGIESGTRSPIVTVSDTRKGNIHKKKLISKKGLP